MAWSVVHTASFEEHGTYVGLLQAPDTGHGPLTWAGSRQSYEVSSNRMSYPWRHSQDSLSSHQVFVSWPREESDAIGREKAAV